ncbi:MAG: 3-isopropylmalate dehydratase small subunit, partial [Planctomycetota bacterium]|nr:3-isopropylmalate dehydratase small subunit [Planctomycetota bacterium]
NQFADIFFNNSFKNGFLPIVLTESEIDSLFKIAEESPGFQMIVDLPTQTVSVDKTFSATFEIDPFRKDCLLNGVDEIDLTLQQLEKIQAFETTRGYPAVD